MNYKSIRNVLLALVLTLALMPYASAEQTLSDDLYSFEAVIDGVHYTFPCAFDELTDNGWTVRSGADEKLQPNQYSFVYFEKEGHTDLTTYAYNCYSSAREVPKCFIAGFKLSTQSYDKLPTVSCVMPRGIELNVSTLDDVIAAYGDPSSRYDGDTRTSLTYRYDGWREIEFSASQGQVVNDIDLQNLTEPIGFVDEVGDTEAVPAVVGLYVPPTKLGDNPLAHVIEIDGALYQIPAPVSVFLDNGFTILEDQTDAIVEGSGSGWVTLSKNNQQLRTLASNYAEDATSIRNCFVTSVSIGKYEANLPAKVALGIEIGMSRTALESALDGVEYLTDEGSSYTVYDIADNERATDAVSVLVSKESDAVYNIEVENSVRRSDIETYLAKAPAMIELPKPLKNEVDPASPLATVDQLSSELSDFQVLVNGRLYAFPMSYETLIGDGWVPSDDPEMVVPANSYERFAFKLGSRMAPKTSLSTYAINMTDEDKKISELPIAGFSISAYDDNREPKTDFALAKGIVLNHSTIDDVLAAYGEPGYRNEQRSFEYEFGRYQTVKLSFDDGLLTGLEVRNFVD